MRRGVIRLGDQIKDIWFRDITSKIPPISTASYIVYTDGSKYYAKNGSTGMIEFVDADASNLLQNVINALAGKGGRIFIRSGVYNITKSIMLIPNLVIEGEAPGHMRTDVRDDQVYSTQAMGVTLNIVDKSVSQVFYYYDDNYWIANVEISKVAVRGGGLVKIGSEGEKWGGHSIRIRDVACRADPLYSSPISTYCIDIWHSLYVLVETVRTYLMPALRFGTDFTTKVWAFGNSVFTDIFSYTAPSNVPHIWFWSKGDPGKTSINLIVIIRPQAYVSGLDLLLDGDSSPVMRITIIGADLEGGMKRILLKGDVRNVTLDLHYNNVVRICKNNAGKVPVGINIVSMFGSFDVDVNGDIIVYEPDCVTDKGVRKWSTDASYGIGLARQILPRIPSWAKSPDIPVMLNENTVVNAYDITSIAGSGIKGDVTNPFARQFMFFKVPAGKTLNAGVNSFKFYTNALTVGSANTGGIAMVFKISGWDQANIDVQARITGFNITYTCYEITVDIINRTGSAVTLSSDLVFAVWTAPIMRDA